MLYPSKKLTLGIVNVGFWVTSAVVVLFCDLHRWLPAFYFESFVFKLVGLTLFYSCYALIQLPFDLYSRHIYSREFGESPGTTFSYLRAVSVHGLVFVGCGLIVLSASGIIFAAVIFVTMVCVLLVGQSFFHRLLNGSGENQDRGFTGGLGFSKPVCSTLFRPEWEEAYKRRLTFISAHSERVRGVFVASFWVTFSFVSALLIVGEVPSGLQNFVKFSCWYTLFSFLGLLVLPRFSRQSTFLLDRELVSKGECAEGLEALMEGVAAFGGERLERTAGEESVFHPAASVVSRVRNLKAEEFSPSVFRGWHAARLAVYFSWAGLGLLSRSVHCNVGRPEVWVFLPTE